MRMTKELLAQLGTCGDYLRKFVRTFPVTDERYADGVVVDRAICEEHADAFDWTWAKEVMLNAEGQRLFDAARDPDDDDVVRAIRDERTASHEARQRATEAWRTSHDEPYSYPTTTTSNDAQIEYRKLTEEADARDVALDERHSRHVAGTFGELFARPELRSERVVQAVKDADRERDRTERRELTTARNAVDETRRSIRYWTDEPARQLAELNRQLPDQERHLVELEQRDRRRVVRRADDELRAALDAVTTAKEAVKRARERKKAAEDAAKRAAEDAATTATDESQPTEPVAVATAAD